MLDADRFGLVGKVAAVHTEGIQAAVDADSIPVLVSLGDSPVALVDRARSLCAGGGYCRVQGWSDPAQVPASLPLTDSARRSLRFSFAAANANGGEAVFFDCRLFSAPDIGTCLPAIP